MRTIIGYLKEYLYEVNKKVLLLSSLFIALFIYFNYHYKIDNSITATYSFTTNFFCHYLIFVIAFLFPYLLNAIIKMQTYFSKQGFSVLLFLAPAIFSFKMALDIRIHFSDDPKMNTYWYYISYWPMLVLVTGFLLFIVWKMFNSEQPIYGIKTKGIDWKPYWLMLLIMFPLIAAASTQPDFQHVYPKMKLITGIGELKDFSFWQKLLFELSYGSDFITIEFFFRGFLVLAFVKWADKDAILPMACFYCTIHFGKPLGECISSYFGGMILGIVVYHTRSIFGGLIVHLGIAWMMEIGGHIGNQLFKTVP